MVRWFIFSLFYRKLGLEKIVHINLCNYLVAVRSFFHTKSGNHCWNDTATSSRNIFERLDSILYFKKLFFVQAV